MRRLGVLALALGLAAPTFGGAGSGPRMTTAVWSSLPTLSQLSQELIASWAESRLPNDLDPSLGAFDEGLSSNEYDGQRGCGQMPGNSDDIAKEVPCTFGDRMAIRSLVVVGDSQANVWMPTFDSWGSHFHWKIYRLMKYACPPWTDAVAWTQCVQWRQFVVRTIRALRPAAVVATGLPVAHGPAGFVRSPSAFSVEQSILGFAREIALTHAGLYILLSTPWFYNLTPPAACMASFPEQLAKCNRIPPTKVLSSTMRSAIAMAVRTGRVRSVPVDQLFCSTRACPEVAGRFNVYVDQDHFQEPWGRHIARAFGQVFIPR
jgi:hypothetical protein